MTLTLDGITISIETNLPCLTYSVEIIIPQEALQEQISIRKGKDVRLEFQQLRGFSTELKLKFDGTYKKDKKGRYIVSEYATFERKNDFYEFQLKLRPKLYVPFQLTQRNRMLKKRKRNKIPPLVIERWVPSAPRQTNYTCNNIRRPWQGGSVTPK